MQNNPEPSDPDEAQQSESERSPIVRHPDSDDYADPPDSYSTQQIQYSYRGPVPDPITLRAYQELYPKAAEQVFDLHNRQAEHRMELDREELRATFRGQWMAFCLGIGGLVVALVLALNDNGGWATGMALGSTAILAGLFITSRLNQDRSTD